MTSAARIVANRRNAARSSGPRTPRGKEQSRRNSFRHGLSLPVRTNDAFARQIIARAEHIVATFGVAPEVAHAVAEVWVELIRARQATVETINQAVAAQQGTYEAALSAQARLALAVAGKASLLASFARYEKRASSSLRKRLGLLEFETNGADKP